MKKIGQICKGFTIIISASLFQLLCSCGETYVSGDNKCDICGKRATYTIGSEEYCNKHYQKARDWCIEKALDR